MGNDGRGRLLVRGCSEIDTTEWSGREGMWWCGGGGGYVVQVNKVVWWFEDC